MEKIYASVALVDGAFSVCTADPPTCAICLAPVGSWESAQATWPFACAKECGGKRFHHHCATFFKLNKCPLCRSPPTQEARAAYAKSIRVPAPVVHDEVSCAECLKTKGRSRFFCPALLVQHRRDAHGL